MFQFTVAISFWILLKASTVLGGSYRNGYDGRYRNDNYGHQVIRAPVISRHHVTYHIIPSYSKIKPTTVEVIAEPIPVNFIFRSASAVVNVQQIHEGARGSLRETFSYDEPHIIKHHVNKPIHQEVHEIIVPQRKIIQQIEPVREEIQTLVAQQGAPKPEPHPEPSERQNLHENYKKAKSS